MAHLSLADAAAQFGGTLTNPDCQFSRVCIDSRKVIGGDLFVAIKGSASRVVEQRRQVADSRDVPRFDGAEEGRGRMDMRRRCRLWCGGGSGSGGVRSTVLCVTCGRMCMCMCAICVRMACSVPRMHHTPSPEPEPLLAAVDGPLYTIRG